MTEKNCLNCRHYQKDRAMPRWCVSCRNRSNWVPRDDSTVDISIQVTTDTHMDLWRITDAFLSHPVVLMIDLKQYQVISISRCGCTGYINLQEVKE